MSFIYLIAMTTMAQENVQKTLPSNPPPVVIDKSVGAKPANSRGRWVTTDDYPVEALRVRAEGTTQITLTVGIDGRVTRCKVSASSGHQALDIAACQAASERALFSAARDAQGRHVEGSYTTRIRWQIPEQAPEEVPERATILHSFTIEKDGKVTNCRFEGPENFNIIGNPCDDVGRFKNPTDADGKPVRKKVAVAIVIRVKDVSEED
ncbi:MAG: energy transducer TonB [Sphingorhabdus sp.]